MGDIVAGRRRDLGGLQARDEIGDMARALAVFQDNAIARRRAEAELLAAKERAEATLAELKETQATLIDAEKLAALGSLVAGVAHEVNNPVGISLTVASSFARRCDALEAQLAGGPLKRSALTAFVADSRDAASQLVTNLQRAGELVQAFKQVAVDRTHAERRGFDLAETTRQIVASLLPGMRKRHVGVEVDVPDGIAFDSYPGPYGQVLTNLFLNAVTHAFEAEDGTIRIRARWVGESQVVVQVSDDGRGMTEEVLRRVFEPFFTTRRGEGGTGLGLHIVYNLVTYRLGGRITVESEPGAGTRFTMILPITAPRDQAPTGDNGGGDA
jgi:signal transduction histidine kinase